MSETLETCAHYDDSAGRCLFGERSWSEACKPKRCAACPMTTEQSRDALVERLARAMGEVPFADGTQLIWADTSEARRDFYRRRARAILPIIAAERAAVWEAAAKVADTSRCKVTGDTSATQDWTARVIAAAIRAQAASHAPKDANVSIVAVSSPPQQPLDGDMMRVWDANLARLYEPTDAPKDANGDPCDDEGVADD